jgi:hypothetical protein
MSTTASGNYSHAEGSYTTASGNYGSHAEGAATTASGYASHAEGVATTASGYASHAEGTFTTASGESSHAEGFFTIACGNKSHAEGQWTRACGIFSHAEGNYSLARSDASHAAAVGQFGTTGDAQYHRGYQKESTENATPKYLAGTTLTVPTDGAQMFCIQVVAFNDTDNETAGWFIRGVTKMINGTMTINGTPSSENYGDTATKACTVAAAVNSNALTVQVTGLANKTIRWHSVFHLSELANIA